MRTAVGCAVGIPDGFEVDVEPHHGSALTIIDRLAD